jgi:His-Xaa-Ser system radical SAM maturase HxsC
MSRQKLHFRGAHTSGLSGRVLGRVTHHPVAWDDRSNYFFAVLRDGAPIPKLDLLGYAAVLIEADADPRLPADIPVPVVSGYEDLSAFTEETVLVIDPESGSTRVLYRPESRYNAIFATGRCNSNCVMCSQPPTLRDDNSIVEEHLRLIELIREPPSTLGITGGEPTLLGHGLTTILARLAQRFPDTLICMLTNGRLYAYEDMVRELAGVRHANFLSAIPLYADVAPEHDYIVQAKGAFDQTLKGLYNAAKYGLQVEIRVVLHRQTVPRLVPLMEFIYRNLPFVSHVALMGLENMGYVKKNWELLWVDPVDYSDVLEKAVKHLFYRRMAVSVYNLPLCILPRPLWRFARKSISDFKNIYLPECDGCEVRPYCAGLFASGETRHSRAIRPIHIDEAQTMRLLQRVCELEGM